MRFLIFSVLFVGFALAADASGSAVYDRGGHFGVRVTGGGGAYAGGIKNSANIAAADANRLGVVTPVPGSSNTSVPDYSKYLSVGWMAPLQLEATYGVTDAFEILLGARYGWSGALAGGDGYIMKSVGAALGCRYYFNDHDPIQAYMSSQLAIDLTQFVRAEGKAAFGFLFDVSSLVGIFLEGNFALAGIFNNDQSIGQGGQMTAGVGGGLHLHF